MVITAMEILSERAALIRESMHKSQAVTDGMVAILGSFDHRLSALETAMRPTQACPYEIPLIILFFLTSSYMNMHTSTYNRLLRLLILFLSLIL